MVCERWAHTQAVIAANPQQRARILGLAPIVPPARYPRHLSRALLVKVVRQAVDSHLEMKRHRRLQEKLAGPKGSIKPEEIAAAVSRATGFSANAIFGDARYCRGVGIIHARHLYCYIVAALRPDLSYPAIAETFVRGRHHTTIMHAIATFPRKRETVPAVAELCAHRSVAVLVETADLAPRETPKGAR